MSGLLILLGVLQYRLWFSERGVPYLWEMEASILNQIEQNRQIEACNRELRAEVIDLKSGRDALEERARSDLGMVKPGEIFIPLPDHQASLRTRIEQHGRCEQVIQ